MCRRKENHYWGKASQLVIHSDLSSTKTKSLSKNRPPIEWVPQRFLIVVWWYTQRVQDNCFQKMIRTKNLTWLVSTKTYRIKPTWYSREGSITLPSLSTDLERLKVDRTVAAVSQIVEMAICVPGHNLQFLFGSVFHDPQSFINRVTKSFFYLRPNPKAIKAGSRIFSSSCPSFINLSGLKADGSG